MSNWRTCFTGGHVLWDDMSFGWTCPTGNLVLWEDIFKRGGHVFWED